MTSNNELPDLVRRRDAIKMKRGGLAQGGAIGLMLGVLGTGYFMGKGMLHAFNYHEREKAAMKQNLAEVNDRLSFQEDEHALNASILPSWSRDLHPSIQLEDTLTGIVRTRAVPKHWNLKPEDVEMGAFRDRPALDYRIGNTSATVPGLVYGVKTEHALAKKIDFRLVDEDPTEQKLPFFARLKQRWLHEKVDLGDLIDASASPITATERVEGEEIRRTKVTLAKGKWTLHLEETINPRLGERALNYTIITGKPNQHAKAEDITYQVRIANDRALYMHKLSAVHTQLRGYGRESGIDGVEFEPRRRK